MNYPFDALGLITYIKSAFRRLNRIYGLLLFLLFCSVSCQNNLNQTTKQDQNDNIKSRVEKIVNSKCNTTIISKEFSYDALAFDIFKADTNKIKSLFINPVTLKLDKATNEEGAPYYLHNFTDGINKIVLFRNEAGFYIEDAEIKNNKILLNKAISIGMQEDAFLKLLKAKNIGCDTITVADDERSFESIYIFRDARLQQIWMGSTVE